MSEYTSSILAKFRSNSLTIIFRTLLMKNKGMIPMRIETRLPLNEIHQR